MLKHRQKGDYYAACSKKTTLSSPCISAVLRSLSLTIIMIFLVSFLFLATTFCNFSHTVCAKAICRESEAVALLRFKNDLKDPADCLSNWAGANCCEWQGISCDESSGGVTGIRLSGCGGKLGGKLNPSLLGLKHLFHLDLSYNDFGGIGIPNFIGSIANLSFLDLSGARFEGIIPDEIGNLSRLQYLNLGDLGFITSKLRVENLQWLSRLTGIKYLDLSGVNLTKADDWLQVMNNLRFLVDLRLPWSDLNPNSSVNALDFASLQVLDLSGNDFNSSVPPWIDKLSNLIHLDLSHCGFYGHLPSGLQNMTHLRYLNLSSNHFNSALPSWLSQLVHLEVLDISDNSIQGELLDDIGNLTSLKYLGLAQNQLKGNLPESVANLCRLEEVYLYENQFSGGLQSLFGCNSQTLRYLYLSQNKFNGSLPDDIGKVSKLRELDLVGNQLTGTLPLSIGQLNELEVLAISLNSFEGRVYESHFRNLTRLKMLRANGFTLRFHPNRTWIPPFQLTSLSLREWHLGPDFPFWIEHLKNLSYLSLARTGISDTIPSWFSNQTFQLSYLNFSGNFMHGPIPSLSNFDYAKSVTVDMKCNFLNGSLPSISPNVKILDLSKNHISGTMHDFICSNANRDNELEILNLSLNQLLGEIPDCWMNWSRLRVLRVDANYKLSGNIPRSIGSLTNLVSLHLRRNNLSGTVPPFLQELTGLKVLDLGRNRFTGQIPVWINQLSKLVAFNLRYNEFIGEIPTEICHLKSLQALDLASNSLSGKIPRCFDNFSVMAGEQPPTDHIYYTVGDTYGGVPESQFLVMKGRFGEYTTNLHWVLTLDLSDNLLSGTIPDEITKLVRLQALNLSRNALTGMIPSTIGDMGSLETIDFSRNLLSGQIPQSISRLHFLSNLNLSYNNLTGKIPPGSQIQGFHLSSFVGNKLCGQPVSAACPETERTPRTEDEDERKGSFLTRDGFGVFVSILLGYVVGFWAVLAPLFLNISWRTTYFRILSRLGNYIYYIWFKLLGRGL